MAAQMETDELPVVLPSSTTSGLSLALCVYILLPLHATKPNTDRHPLPILNISEHLTRLKLQTRSSNPVGVYVTTAERRVLDQDM